MRLFLHLACLTVFAFFATNDALAQPEELIPVGLQPLALIQTETELHVFCNRIDLNFNGVQDEGDSPASWWVIDRANRTASQRVAFDWDDGFGFPFRPTADIANNLLFLPLAEEVRAYNLANGDVDLSVPQMPYVAAAAFYDAVSNEILISQRQSDASDILRTFSLDDESTETYEVGDNVGQSLVWTDANEERRILVLCEGIFGEDNSVLSVLTPGADPVRMDIALGGTANHLLLQEDMLYVTMNADHLIHEIDLNAMAIQRSIEVGTEGFNGPRDAVIVDGDIYVTTYSDDVRRFDLESGDLKATLTTGAKPEGIVHWNGRLWIANAYVEASFVSDQTVAVLHPKLSTEVAAVVPTVLQPAHLRVIPQGVLVYGNQVDLNFNTIQEDGDLPQHIALHSTEEYESEWISELSWGGGSFPLRPALNLEDQLSYVINGQQLTAQFLNNPSSIAVENIVLGNASAVSYSAEAQTLAVSERGDASGIVRLFNTSSGEFVESTVTGLTPFVQQTLWPGDVNPNFSLIVLEEGDFNGGAGRLAFLDHVSATIVSTLELGAGANHMFQDGNTLYVTINGAHEVIVVDLTTTTISQRIATGTEGFNGPRESIVFDGDLFVTTYSNDVRRFDVTSGEMTASYETGGKPESLVAFEDQLWVCNAFEYNDFASGYTLAILEPGDAVTSVEDNQQFERVDIASLTLSPNPAVREVRIDLPAELQFNGMAELELVALNGQIVRRARIAATDLASGRLQIDISGLLAGMYVVNLRAGESLYSSRLIVQP